MALQGSIWVRSVAVMISVFPLPNEVVVLFFRRKEPPHSGIKQSYDLILKTKEPAFLPARPACGRQAVGGNALFHQCKSSMNTFLSTPLCPYAFRRVGKCPPLLLWFQFISGRGCQKGHFPLPSLRKNNPNRLSVLPTIIRDEPRGFGFIARLDGNRSQPVSENWIQPMSTTSPYPLFVASFSMFI